MNANPSEILTSLGVKGATVIGGAGRDNCLMKTNALGTLDNSMFPFVLNPVKTYYVDVANGAAAPAGTGSPVAPFQTIAQALAANVAEGASPLTIILARGTYAGASISNSAQTTVTIFGFSPVDTVINSALQVTYVGGSSVVNLTGVQSSSTLSRTSNGAFAATLMGGALTGNVSAATVGGNLTIYPGSSATAGTNMTAVYPTPTSQVNYTIETGTANNWTGGTAVAPTNPLVTPVMANTALDRLVYRVRLAETAITTDVLLLDGTSKFDDGVGVTGPLFTVEGTADNFEITFYTEDPAADAIVTFPALTGTLALLRDAATTGALKETWSADKLVTQFSGKAAKVVTGTAADIVVLSGVTPFDLASSTKQFGVATGNVPSYATVATDNVVGLQADAIKELTAGHGVSFVGAAGSPVSKINVDNISEYTSTNGVVVQGLRFQDGLGTAAAWSGLAPNTGNNVIFALQASADGADCAVRLLNTYDGVAELRGWSIMYHETTKTAVSLVHTPYIANTAAANPTLQLDYDSVGANIQHTITALQKINIDVTGATATYPGYYVGASKVVGTRVTGWTAASGTATRTTFDTATVVIEDLAQRVKALIDDLIAHGLIGT